MNQLNIDIEDQKVVKDLRQELKTTVENWENDKKLYASIELDMREMQDSLLKMRDDLNQTTSKNKILKKFIKLECQSPTSIVNEFMAGKLNNESFLSQHKAGSVPIDSPLPFNKSVSKFNLNHNPNIF